MSKLITKQSTVVTLVAAAVLAGGAAAFAYPPDHGITVTAVTDGSPDALVTINNANPNCDTSIDVDDTTVKTVPATHSTVTNNITTTVSVAALSVGRHSISVRTEGCTKGSKEHAKSKFVVTKNSGNITYPTDAHVGTSYRIEFSGLTPDTTVVSVIVTGPGKQDSDSAKVDRRGEASLKVKFKKPGTWSVVTTITTPSGHTDETKTITVS